VDFDGVQSTYNCPECNPVDTSAYLQNSGLYEREQKYTLSGLDTDSNNAGYLQCLARKLRERSGIVLVHGRAGRGKTYPAMGMIADACRLGINARYASAPDMIAMVSAGIEDGSGYSKELDALLEADMLVLDEFEKGGTSKTVTSFIDKRIRAADIKCTVFIANDTSNAPEYLVSRVMSGEVFHIQGIDRRRK
jgi:DNA replication protein DnaC